MSSIPSPDLLLPEPKDLHGHLVDQLDFLRNRDGKLSRNKNRFRVNWAQIKDADPETWTLDIEPNWIVELTTQSPYTADRGGRDFSIKNGVAVIGGIIEAEENEFQQYSLHLTLLARHDSEVRGAAVNGPCCWRSREEDAEWRVAKQYHFDIDIGNNEHEDKPITHLQSGGTFDPSHLPPGYDTEEVHYCSTPLDKPRLPHPPMDPILLLQMVSEQYKCPDDLESEHWEPRVLDSESMLWENFYHRVSEHLDVADRSVPFNSLVSNGRL